MTGRQRIADILIAIIILIFSTAAPAAVVFAAKGFDLGSCLYELCGAMLVGGAASVMQLFSVFYMDIKGHRVFGIKGQYSKFIALYVIFLMISCAVSIISPLCVPVPFFAVMIMYYSGLEPALVCVLVYAAEMIAVSDFAPGAVISVVFSGIASVIIFSAPEKPLSYVKKSLISGLIAVMSYASMTLTTIEEIGAADIIDPVVGTLVSVILLIIFTRRYSKKYLETFDELFEKINDPEHELLVSLKEQNKEEYMIAIHTAQLCDRIATRMELDRVLCKCLGFYHRIGVLNGGRAHKNTVDVAEKYNFPAPAVLVLTEYQNAKKEAPKRSETIICIFANDIVSSIRYLSAEKGKESVDYDKIIEYVTDKKISEGIMKNSTLTFSDVEKIKRYFREEHLYYDFLC